tara:strand:+ start:854 stop:1105 length:252 start_codon:yes stop_codon:yes gene_type:complete
MTANSKTIVEGMNEYCTVEYESRIVNKREAEAFQDWVYENMASIYELKLNHKIYPTRNGMFEINWWGTEYVDIQDILNGEAEL